MVLPIIFDNKTAQVYTKREHKLECTLRKYFNLTQQTLVGKNAVLYSRQTLPSTDWRRRVSMIGK